MYKLAILVVLVAGCSQEPPDLRPLVAVTGRYSLMAQKTSPAPAPGAKCKGCRGLGTVGDGRTSVTCSRCNGTGVEPATASSTAPAPICKDGKCSTPPTVR